MAIAPIEAAAHSIVFFMKIPFSANMKLYLWMPSIAEWLAGE
jgi:hypothetical protein